MTAYQHGFGDNGLDHCDTTSLSEILSAFSYALDLTEGQPEGHANRCCWIASQMALRLELPPEQRRTIFFATMLKDLGCSSNAARIAELYRADDRVFKHDHKLVGNGLAQVLRFVFSHTGEGEPLAARAATIANILRNGSDIAQSLIETRCERGAEIARLLRFPEDVSSAIFALDEHWDGSGKPLRLSGDAIPLASRMALLAQIADVFHAKAGADAAREEIARQSGHWLDPMLCRLFDELCREEGFWEAFSDPDFVQQLIALEPEQGRIALDDDYLDDIAAAFGAVIDAKSPFTQGHSERVGIYSDAIAAELGLADADRRALRRAARLHDVGKLGVSSRVLEKPGKLDAAEWQAIRNHALQTSEILSRINPLRGMALIAGSHHERLDGKGYPMGLDADLLSLETRIITVSDIFDALTADRPYRAAMTVPEALAIMQVEVGVAIDGDCFAALREVIRKFALPPLAG